MCTQLIKLELFSLSLSPPPLLFVQVESDESRHRPRDEVIWMKDGQIIVTRGNRKYRNFGKKKKLQINNPQVEDSGVYECAHSLNSTEKGRAELWSELWPVHVEQIIIS